MTSSKRSSAPVEDADRLTALQKTGLMDSPAEVSFDRLTHLVQTLLRVPVALVSLVDTQRQFFKSSAGLPEPWCTLRQTPLSHSFCQHVVASAASLVIEDARRNPFVLDNLAILDLHVVGYLGIPLRAPSGHVIGSLCAIESQPRVWSDNDIETLSELEELVIPRLPYNTNCGCTSKPK